MKVLTQNISNAVKFNLEIQKILDVCHQVEYASLPPSQIVPTLLDDGKYIVGNSEPYEYLTKTIEDFYNQEELSNIFQKNGFENVEFRNLSGGIVALHSGWKI